MNTFVARNNYNRNIFEENFQFFLSQRQAIPQQSTTNTWIKFIDDNCQVEWKNTRAVFSIIKVNGVCFSSIINEGVYLIFRVSLFISRPDKNKYRQGIASAIEKKFVLSCKLEECTYLYDVFKYSVDIHLEIQRQLPNDTSYTQQDATKLQRIFCQGRNTTHKRVKNLKFYLLMLLGYRAYKPEVKISKLCV